MSTTAIRPVAQTAASDEDARLAEYRARVDILRRTYRRRASRNGVVANCLSLLLVATGAAVGLSPISDPKVTAGLGVTVILLEGIARVMKPALRAAGARTGVAQARPRVPPLRRVRQRLPLRQRQGRRGVHPRGRAGLGAGRRQRRARRVGRHRRATRPEQSRLRVAVHHGESAFSRHAGPPSQHGESAVPDTASPPFVRVVPIRRAQMPARDPAQPVARNARPWVARRPPVRHTDRTNIR